MSKKNDLMVSFDMVSLFTKVPIADSLELFSYHFEDDVQALFKHILISTYFGFEGKFYEQTDGIAMGSPLSPATAKFFMEDFEKKVLEQETHKPVCFFWYVDDTSSGPLAQNN
jgi:Reverse transcriptase (RNA-dependent DNA polymerase).